MRNAALGCAAFLLSCAAGAAPVTVSSVTGTGSFTNAASIAADGLVPPETTWWTDPTAVWWNGQEGESGVVLTLAFDQIYTLEALTLSVDNNDSYRIDVSLDGSAWSLLGSVAPADGNVSEGVGGLDTFSSAAASADFAASLAFSPTAARYARIYVTGGDAQYAVGELAFTAAVPEPQTWALMLAGGLALARFGRRSAARRS